MKHFDTRTYSINDFIEWDDNGQLELAPKFQRRSVWTDSARSYLMDTIIRGKPIPKVFIRQKINPTTKKTVREVVDGQQRLRTILSYVRDGFRISKKHNEDFGGIYFSQLETKDSDVQSAILNYEISVDLLVSMSDKDVLDVFSRLNSYAITLNEQEKINALHFGPFKNLADNLAHEYYEFWISNRVLTEQQVLRMGDVSLVAELLIAMIDGIQSKKQIKSYYTKFEEDLPHNPKKIRNEFSLVMSQIIELFGNELRGTAFRRIHVFYTLFTSLYHINYRLKNCNIDIKLDFKKDKERILHKLDKISQIFTVEDRKLSTLRKAELQFLQDARRATTDQTVRLRRTRYLINLLKK